MAVISTLSASRRFYIKTNEFLCLVKVSFYGYLNCRRYKSSLMLRVTSYITITRYHITSVSDIVFSFGQLFHKKATL